MAESSTDPSIYPVAYGNELETSVIVQRTRLAYDELFPGDDRFATPVTHYEAPRNVSAFIPRELQPDPAFAFLTNGFKVYNGGNGQSRIEVATPECASVSELVAVTRAGELLIEEGSRALLVRNPKSDIHGIRIQKRVADKHGNTWGCHDNFGFAEQTARRISPHLPMFLGRFLASRSFMTGAGMLGEDGYLFSQKIGNTSTDKGYGFFARHYRDAANIEEDIKRIEVGSSDANVSDWATAVRFGSVAILLSILASGQEDRIARYFDERTYDNSVSAFGQVRNGVHYSSDSRGLKLNIEQVRSVDMHRAVAETFLGSVADQTGAPRELRRLAGEIVRYCDDFSAVANEKKTIADLADRADWAARLEFIVSKVGDDRNDTDFERKLSAAHGADVNYDVTLLIRGEQGKIMTHYGRGLKMRSRGKLLLSVSDAEARRYYAQAPDTTRAAARSRLLGSGQKISSVDWEYVSLELAPDEIHKILLLDATDPHVPAYAQRFIA